MFRRNKKKKKVHPKNNDPNKTDPENLVDNISNIPPELSVYTNDVSHVNYNDPDEDSNAYLRKYGIPKIDNISNTTNSLGCQPPPPTSKCCTLL